MVIGNFQTFTSKFEEPENDLKIFFSNLDVSKEI